LGWEVNYTTTTSATAAITAAITVSTSTAASNDKDRNSLLISRSSGA
jgi:hypothetical protein